MRPHDLSLLKHHLMSRLQSQFLDHPNTKGEMHFGTGMRAAFKLQNASAVFNRKCLAQRSGNE